jgi:hypothetical protein
MGESMRLVREPDTGDLPVRFDERDVETEPWLKAVRHRQTKEAATDMFYLKPPRHISTLPRIAVLAPLLKNSPSASFEGRVVAVARFQPVNSSKLCFAFDRGFVLQVIIAGELAHERTGCPIL